jgi:hypothetical protein
MIKEFQKAPVYTKDSVSYIKDDKKKQKVIDNMTSHLADRMAMITSDRALVNEFGLDIDLVEHRGGHNRRTVEMLNGDGYLVHVFHSITDAAKFFGTSIDTINRICRGARKFSFGDGTLRYREKPAKKKSKNIHIKKQKELWQRKKKR